MKAAVCSCRLCLLDVLSGLRQISAAVFRHFGKTFVSSVKSSQLQCVQHECSGLLTPALSATGKPFVTVLIPLASRCCCCRRRRRCCCCCSALGASESNRINDSYCSPKPQNPVLNSGPLHSVVHFARHVF